MVECQLPKLKVAGSNPVSRSSEKVGVYILECHNKSYYIGSTDNLDRRVKQHADGKAKATMYLRPLTLKAFITSDDLKSARRLELVIKNKKSRKYTEKMIQQFPVEEEPESRGLRKTANL